MKAIVSLLGYSVPQWENLVIDIISTECGFQCVSDGGAAESLVENFLSFDLFRDHTYYRFITSRLGSAPACKRSLQVLAWVRKVAH